MPPLLSAAITVLAAVVVALAYYYAETLAVWLIERLIIRLMSQDTISENDPLIPEGETNE